MIGVTGSLGTGKSTVARMLAACGAHLMDADRLAHQAFVPGTPVWRRLHRRFGDAVLRVGGAIDRRALARAGFTSRRAWRDLCRIIHPAVIAATRRRLAAIRRRHRSAVVVLDVPLLIESGMTSWVDWLVVVTADRATQMARLKAAGRWSASEIRRRLRWQMPLRRKVRLADFVVDNGGSRRATAAQVERVWQAIQHKEMKHG